MIVATFAMVATARGQEQEGFTKHIEVQKEYEVVVRGAERIEQEVALLDTTIVRPELSYRIRPTAHIVEFEPRSLEPLPISAAEWSVPTNLYLNVGAGLPLQSEADIYWSPVANQNTQLLVWLNHEGSEGRTTNLDGERTSALLVRNRAGVSYGSTIGERTHLSADVVYRGSLGESYGGVGVGDGKRPFVSVHDVEARVKIAGTYNDKSPLAYDANAMGLYAWNGVGENVWRFNFNYGLVGLNRVKSWLPRRVEFHYSGVNSTCREPYYDTSVTLVPEWSFRLGRWIPVDVMAGYDHMVYKGANNSLNGVVSSIAASYDRYAFAVPYVTVANDVQTQATRRGLWNNPYMAMLPVDSRKIFLAELGVKGDVGRVTYKLSGATRWFSTYMFEVVTEGSPLLDYGYSKGQRVWYGEAEALWRATRTMTLEAGVRYTSLGVAESATAEFRPRSWEGHLEMRLVPAKRWEVRVGGEWKTAMEVTCRKVDGSAELMEVPGWFDLGVEGVWHRSERTSVWLRGDNLLNQPIYHWATYKAPGAGFRMGVSICF